MRIIAQNSKSKRISKVMEKQKINMVWKITVIKSILLLQINYTISTIEANKNFADELQKCLVSFLWDEKPAKIKFTTAIGEQYKGG